MQRQDYFWIMVLQTPVTRHNHRFRSTELINVSLVTCVSMRMVVEQLTLDD